MSREAILTSKVEAASVLRRVGYLADAIEEMLNHLPDPFELERALLRRGLTIETLENRMGASP